MGVGSTGGMGASVVVGWWGEGRGRYRCGGGIQVGWGTGVMVGYRWDGHRWGWVQVGVGTDKGVMKSSLHVVGVHLGCLGPVPHILLPKIIRQ